MAIVGFIDRISANHITGWVVRRSEDDCIESLTPSFQHEDVVLEGAAESVPRPDVAANLNVDEVSGFKFLLDKPLTMAMAAEIVASVEEDEELVELPVSGGFELCPSDFHLASLDDFQNHGLLRGWTADVSGDAEALIMPDSIVIDGESIDLKLFREDRPDVEEFLGGAPCFGFRCPVPFKFFDGKKHAVEVSRQGTELTSKVYRFPEPSGISSGVAGRITARRGKEISGHAVSMLRPDQDVKLTLMIDGHHAADFQTGSHFCRSPFSASEQLRGGFTVRIPGNFEDSLIHEAKVCTAAGGHVVGKIRFCLPKKLQTGLPAARSIKLPFASHDAGDGETGELVSLLILNRDGGEKLRTLFESIVRFEDARHEIIVVDNASSDDSLAVIEEFSGRLNLKIIALPYNSSFSAGNNLAARAASNDYLMFVNNDLRLTQPVIEQMAATLSDENVAIVGLCLKEQHEAYPDRIHHAGITFDQCRIVQGKVAQPWPVEINQAMIDRAGELPMEPVAVDAVTAACAMVRAGDFEAVGGFDEQYFYGMEDVDLNIRLKQQENRIAVCRNDLSALHDCSATRRTNDSRFFRQAQKNNRSFFSDRFGYALRKRYQQRKNSDEAMVPMTFAFAVSEASWCTPAGDFFTAAELADALAHESGSRIRFCLTPQYKSLSDLEYALPEVDAVIAMNFNYEPHRVAECNASLIQIAWIRNRADQWLETNRLDLYDLILVSSSKLQNYIWEQLGREAVVFPIATNPRRFVPGGPDSHQGTMVFTGSAHAGRRPVVDHMLDLHASDGLDFSVYGHGWESDHEVAGHWRGAAPYLSLAKIYQGFKLVIDDCHPVALDWHSMNSRPFDAIAAGALPLTNNVAAVKELFGDFPITYDSAESLRERVNHFMSNGQERDEAVSRLRDLVTQEHSYDVRARKLLGLLEKLADGQRIAIRTGVPKPELNQSWGDYHFAKCLRAEFERRGHRCKILTIADWDHAEFADVVIDVVGLSYPKPVSGAINLLWLISHPERFSPEVLKRYDHVFVASDTYAGKLVSAGAKNVSTLLQFGEPELFFPPQEEEKCPSSLLFVGNSRGVFRDSVKYALQGNFKPTIYGGGWEGVLDDELVSETHIPNAELRKHYGACDVLLNDHWDDMREEGFLSNRIFEAGLCGCVIFTDRVSGMEAVVGDLLPTYEDFESFSTGLKKLMADQGLRSRLARELREVVLEKHTTRHRVDDIMNVIAEIVQNQLGSYGGQSLAESNN